MLHVFWVHHFHFHSFCQLRECSVLYARWKHNAIVVSLSLSLFLSVSMPSDCHGTRARRIYGSIFLCEDVCRWYAHSFRWFCLGKVTSHRPRIGTNATFAPTVIVAECVCVCDINNRASPFNSETRKLGRNYVTLLGFSFSCVLCVTAISCDRR